MGGTDLRDLGRRATACKGWRWLQGMVDHDGNICIEGGNRSTTGTNTQVRGSDR